MNKLCVRGVPVQCSAVVSGGCRVCIVMVVFAVDDDDYDCCSPATEPADQHLHPEVHG